MATYYQHLFIPAQQELSTPFYSCTTVTLLC